MIKTEVEKRNRRRQGPGRECFTHVLNEELQQSYNGNVHYKGRHSGAGWRYDTIVLASTWQTG